MSLLNEREQAIRDVALSMLRERLDRCHAAVLRIDRAAEGVIDEWYMLGRLDATEADTLQSELRAAIVAALDSLVGNDGDG